MAKVFDVNQLARQVINLLDEQKIPMFVAEDVLAKASDYISCQKVTATNEYTEKIEEETAAGTTGSTLERYKKLIQEEDNTSQKIELDKDTGLFKVKIEHS